MLTTCKAKNKMIKLRSLEAKQQDKADSKTKHKVGTSHQETRKLIMERKS